MNYLTPQSIPSSNNQMSGNKEPPALIYKPQTSPKPVKSASLKHRLLERASIDGDLQNIASEWTVTSPPQPSSSVQLPPAPPPPPLSQPSPVIAEYQPLSSTINSTQMANISTLSGVNFVSDAGKPQMPCASKQEIDVNVFGSLPQEDSRQLVHMAPLVTAHQPMSKAYTQSVSQTVMNKEVEIQTSREAMPMNEIKLEPTEGIQSTKPTSAITNSTVSIASSSVNVSTNSKTGKTKEAFTRNCAVCEDLASGYHYGVWSCEGCKAFFKRSIQGSAEYVCPATNECTIDKHRRKSCQACRLRKCYNVGMMRGGVRKDRKPGGRSKYKRPSEDNTYGENGIPNKRKVCNPILMTLVGAEKEQVHFTENVDHSEQNFLMKTLIQLADRQLLQVITWAKQIPGYTTLELDDQVRLLENSWLEILLVSLCYKSMQYKGEKICFAQGLTIGREEYAASGFSDLCQHIASLSNKFAALRITLEEFVCLKALVLVNSAMELQSQEQLAKLQDDLTDALTEAVEFSNPTEARRLPKLLMLLTHLRHLSCKGIAQLFEVKNSGNVPLYDLLLEMLDANTLISRQQKLVQEPVGETPHVAQGQDQSGNCEKL